MISIISVTLLSLLTITTAMNIECDFKVHSTYGYGCEVKIIENPDKEILKVKGIHEAGKSNEDVKYFMASDKEIKNFPQKLHECFSNLETISLNFSSLARICHEDLEHFGTLKNFMLQNNSLTFLPFDLFKSTPNILHIYMNSFKNISVDKETFTPLKKLQSLFVKFNCMDEDAINPNAVQELIEKLKISCFDTNFKVPTSCKMEILDYDEKEQVECPASGSIALDGSTPATEEPGTFHYWIIGVVVLIALVVIGIFVVRKTYK